MALDMNRLREFSELYLKRKYHQEEAAKLTEKIGEKQPGLLEHMVDEGADKVSMPGGVTIVIASQIWPKYGDKSNAIKAIKAAQIKGMLEEGFNHNRLAGYIREKIRAGEELPEEFDGLISADEVQKLVAKKL